MDSGSRMPASKHLVPNSLSWLSPPPRAQVGGDHSWSTFMAPSSGEIGQYSPFVGEGSGPERTGDSPKDTEIGDVKARAEPDLLHTRGFAPSHPRRHLAMSGWGRATGNWWVEAKDVAKLLEMHRTGPHDREWSSSQRPSCWVEKPLSTPWLDEALVAEVLGNHLVSFQLSESRFREDEWLLQSHRVEPRLLSWLH